MYILHIYIYIHVKATYAAQAFRSVFNKTISIYKKRARSHVVLLIMRRRLCLLYLS